MKRRKTRVATARVSSRWGELASTVIAFVVEPAERRLAPAHPTTGSAPARLPRTSATDSHPEQAVPATGAPGTLPGGRS